MDGQAYTQRGHGVRGTFFCVPLLRMLRVRWVMRAWIMKQWRLEECPRGDVVRGEAWHCDDYAALCVTPLYHSSARPLAPLTFLVYDTRKKSVKGATASRNSRLVWRPQHLIKRQRRWPAVDHYPRQSDNVEAAPQLAGIVLSLGWAAAARGNASQCWKCFLFVLYFFYILFLFHLALEPPAGASL